MPSSSPVNFSGPNFVVVSNIFRSTLSSKPSGLYEGLLYASASSMFFSLCSVIVKKLDYMHPGQLACLRFIGIFVCTLPFVLYRQQPLFGSPDVRSLLIFRGLAGSTSLFLRFCALHYLPLADASVIIFSVPVFVGVMAKIFLNEACTLFHWMSTFATLFGIALITKLSLFFGSPFNNTSDIVDLTQLETVLPPFLSSVPSSDRTEGDSTAITSSTNRSLNYTLPVATTLNSPLKVADATENELQRFYGIASALLSTFFSAAVYVLLRKLRDIDHFVIMLNFGWVAILETLTITLLFGTFTPPRSPMDQLLIGILCIFSFIGQLCLTHALQNEQAGPVSVVRSTVDIILVFIWQLIFFAEIPDGYSISGAILVSSCVILTGLRKWLLSLPESSAAKRRLYFLII
ncbi:solute carrier family 35 member G1-like isoform X2 [Varroa jacobsoni]|nr:solute carrier family 35 member G1-like isoform X2 [Varroa jacobsoni]XP_022708105.1 solute carrier family 35 member G1-like isoform X2 [Varroa jacobsoni]